MAGPNGRRGAGHLPPPPPPPPPPWCVGRYDRQAREARGAAQVVHEGRVEAARALRGDPADSAVGARDSETKTASL